jgi:preprotein translocase subunit SecA
VQLIGGIILHQGKIAEMKTGEGKTLVATLPVYLNALAGKGAMSSPSTTISPGATPNGWARSTLPRPDRRRDRARHRRRGAARGLRLRRDLRHQQRARLRLSARQHEVPAGGHGPARHNYAIVDEVDSILIDEARTPLIISGPTQDQSALYIAIDKIIPDLAPEHYEIDEKQKTAILTEDGNEHVEQLLRDAGLLSGERRSTTPRT